MVSNEKGGKSIMSEAELHETYLSNPAAFLQLVDTLRGQAYQEGSERNQPLIDTLALLKRIQQLNEANVIHED